MAKKKESAHDFGKLLTRLMDEQGVTVQKAASMAGVAKSTVQHWRSGVLPTNFEAVRRLAHALGTSLSMLLTGHDDTRPAGAPSMSEVFDASDLFEGLLEVKVRRLVPKRGSGGGRGSA